MPRTHDLKTYPSYFNAAWEESKTFEIRENNRDFCVGDTIRLLEFDPIIQHKSCFTGRWIMAIITYIFPGGRLGLDANNSILSFRMISKGVGYNG